MTSVFKNRLIGSAILMIAAIVFLPDLLDGQKQVSKDDFKAIPDRPEFAQVAEPQVFQRAQHDAARAQAQALPVDNQTVLDNSTDPVPAGDVLPNQQYASVSTDSKAAQPSQQTAQMVSQPAQSADAAISAAQTQTPTAGSAGPATDPAPVTNSPKTTTEASIENKEPTVSQATPKPLSQSAWVVKVGSFSKEQNANALVAKLREAGFATFSRKIVNSQGQTMISVVVGPDLQKEKLEKNLSKLQQLANAPALKVTAFSPTEKN